MPGRASTRPPSVSGAGCRGAAGGAAVPSRARRALCWAVLGSAGQCWAVLGSFRGGWLGGWLGAGGADARQCWPPADAWCCRFGRPGRAAEAVAAEQWQPRRRLCVLGGLPGAEHPARPPRPPNAPPRPLSPALAAPAHPTPCRPGALPGAVHPGRPGQHRPGAQHHSAPGERGRCSISLLRPSDRLLASGRIRLPPAGAVALAGGSSRVQSSHNARRRTRLCAAPRPCAGPPPPPPHPRPRPRPRRWAAGGTPCAW